MCMCVENEKKKNRYEVGIAKMGVTIGMKIGVTCPIPILSILAL